MLQQKAYGGTNKVELLLIVIRQGEFEVSRRAAENVNNECEGRSAAVGPTVGSADWVVAFVSESSRTSSLTQWAR